MVCQSTTTMITPMVSRVNAMAAANQGAAMASNTTPVTVTGLSGVVQISAGGRHVCALDRDQMLWCWGEGKYGQLGNGTFFMLNVTEPVAATVFTDIVEVACGEAHTCIRNSQNQVQCIGLGGHGEVGDGMFHSTNPFGIATPATVLQL